MENLRNKIVFTATFFSKLAFGIFFTVACYFIQSDVVDNDMEAAIEICGGEDWYEWGEEYWNVTLGFRVRVPWDEKVVNCLHNARGGLFTAGAVCLLLSILLEAKPALKKDGKFPLVMFLLQVVSSLLIFGAVVSEMEIMKRMKSTTSKIFQADDFEALFIIDYPKLSSNMWIVGFAFLLLGQLYTLFQHRHSGVRVLSTYTIAGLGTFLLLLAGILRSDIGNRVYLRNSVYDDSGDVVNQMFHLDTKFISDIVVLMISGSVFFIIHAVMFFFFLYDEVVLVTEEEDLSHEEIAMEEGQDSPLEIDEKDKDEVEKDLSLEEIAMEEGQD